ncbi:hypothetical protein FACS1894186_4560 [Alphaproteobacteria bacterium]|nr:hypothetical protein FACS1894186_4560 [Alphaproteobacteria bacterium]
MGMKLLIDQSWWPLLEGQSDSYMAEFIRYMMKYPEIEASSPITRFIAPQVAKDMAKYEEKAARLRAVGPQYRQKSAPISPADTDTSTDTNPYTNTSEEKEKEKEASGSAPKPGVTGVLIDPLFKFKACFKQRPEVAEHFRDCSWKALRRTEELFAGQGSYGLLTVQELRAQVDKAQSAIDNRAAKDSKYA